MSDPDQNPDDSGTNGTGTGGTETGEAENRTGEEGAENRTGEEGVETDPTVSWGRFGRIVVLVAFVSFVFLFTAADALAGVLFQVAVVVIGGVALVTAIVGFLITVASVAG